MSGFRFFGKKKSTPAKTREAKFAGSWYEADSGKLNDQLDEFLQIAKGKLSRKTADSQFQDNLLDQFPVGGNLLCAVSPHAGFMFSGQTAAFSFAMAAKEIENRKTKVNRVFLLGPSHYVGFEGAALSEDMHFQTPLGDLPVDRQAVEELVDFPLFRYMTDAHRKEHSLEMQLPLIYKVFGAIKIVPIIIGTLENEMEVRLVAGEIRRFLRDDDIVIVSTDFCHVGPRYQYQPFKSDIRNKVYEMDKEAFIHLNARSLEDLMAFKARTGATICGFSPLCVMLALLPNNAGASVLNYASSQDSIVEDDENSVSYMSIACGVPRETEKLWGSDASTLPDSQPLTEEDRANLLTMARAAITSACENKSVLTPIEEFKTRKSILAEPRGVFVTLFKRNPSGRELRGCIGHIWPVRPLAEAVVENAVGAAMRDYRFAPMEKNELESLQIEISVLTPLRRVASYNEIVIGRDGIVFYKNNSQAVFLPHVAEQYGWTLEQTLTQLALKAGLSEGAWKEGAKFDIFQAESFEEDE